jgi:hypothetical protein
MKQYTRNSSLAAILFLALALTAQAQAPPFPPGPPVGMAPAPAPIGFGQGTTQARPRVALKVQIVIARYEGDKKVSSLPYTMSVTANGEPVRLRMGSQIPVPSTSYQGNANTTPVVSYTYHNVGTGIDCSATSTDDGRFNVFVGIEDSSVSERRANDAAPTLRNFTTQNTVLLRDGQTMQFTAAADKTTGEVVKVDVTLTVEK